MKNIIGIVCMVILVSGLCACAESAYIIKPLKGSLTVKEGIIYNSNPGYADKGNHDSDWANRIGANTNIELPFGGTHRFTHMSSISWVKFFSVKDYDQLNMTSTSSLDFIFKNWSFNIHYNPDHSYDPTAEERTVLTRGRLKRKVQAGGAALQADLGKMKLGTGLDMMFYRTNDTYDILERDSYSTYIDLSAEVIDLLDAFIKYTYTHTNRKSSLRNDSNGQDVKIGARGILTPYLTGEVGVGFGYVDFEHKDNSLDDNNFTGFVYSGSLTNRLSSLTTQTLAFSLSPEQGYNVGNYYEAYVTTYRLNHRLNSKMDINGLAEYVHSKESGGPAAFKETSKIWTWGIGANYALAKKMNLGADYTYTNKESNSHGKNYGQHSVVMELSYTF